MGHIKTNKTLHLTEILTLLKSTFKQQKNQVERLFRFSKTTARILRPTLSNLFATPSENHIVWANLSCYSVNRFSKNRRGTTRACIEFSRAVWGFTDRLWTNQISWYPVCMSWSCNNYYLLTGCKGRTRKYKPKVFHTARACEGFLENQGLVFPGTARAPS